MKTPTAIEQAALALELSRYRAWQLHYRQPGPLRHAEYVAIMRARVGHLYREIAELELLTAELRNTARQAELKLEAEQSAWGLGWNVSGVGSRHLAPGSGVVR